MAQHRFVAAVRRAIAAHDLFPAAGIVIVACSGGADSLALLLALDALCGQAGRAYPAVSLHVAHLDHGLRGAESAADAAFVAAEAARLGLDATIVTLTKADRADWRGSLEAAARGARYAFLRQVARQRGAAAIATGHTADDQAETVLLHLLRGSGLDGLAGMRPSNGAIIRPLLDCWRSATEEFCRDMGRTPRDDSSNRDPRYLRNRVRHELIPLAEQLQPRCKAALVRNAALIADDRAALEAATDAAWSGVIQPAIAPLSDQERTAWILLSAEHVGAALAADFALAIARADLRALAPAIRHRVIRRALDHCGSADPDAQADAASLARIERVALDTRGTPRIVEIGTGAVIFVTRTHILFAPPQQRAPRAEV